MNKKKGALVWGERRKRKRRNKKDKSVEGDSFAILISFHSTRILSVNP